MRMGAIVLLSILLCVALVPLGLMVYGSLKPVGTFGWAAQELVVDEWIPEMEGFPLRSDMRKFRSVSFWVKGEKGGESLRVVLKDALGHETSLSVDPFLKKGITQMWQQVTIPVRSFDLSSLLPSLPEKIAETIIFKQEGTMSIRDVRLRFRNWTLDHYKDILISGLFGRYFLNSLFIAFAVVLGNLLFSAMVGYAFARKDFAGKEILFILVLASIMIPPQVLMIPVFILMKNIGWLNTYWSLTIPNLVLPFNIFLMRQYISALPRSLEDAARMDGAGDFQVFFNIVLPLTKPALAVVGINTFIGCWNAFLYPFLLTNTAEMRTLPVGLALYKELQGVDWAHLLAGAGVTAFPVILVFLFFQRYIIAGITAGAVRR